MAQQEQPIKTEEKHHHDHDHDDSDSDHEGHDHGEGQGHDDKEKKANRGEKKFKKAMLKLGLTQVTGIARVTIRKGKSLLIYIEDPEVFKTPGVENSFIVLGEPKINDFPGNIAAGEAEKFKEPSKPTAVQAEKKVEETVATQAEEGEEDESKLPPDSIKMVMDHCKCDRKAAVKALLESGGDSVNAILKLSS